MTILDYLDANLAMWQPWGHVTSSKVTPCFIANSFALKRATALFMVSLCSNHQDASNDIHFDLKVTLRSRDLRSPLDLDFIRSWYTYFDAHQRENLDGAVSSALAQLGQKLLAKYSRSPVPPFWLFWPLWRHFLPDLKMTWVKNVELVRPYLMPFTAWL